MRNVANWERYADRHRGMIFALAGGLAGIIQAWHSRGALSPDLLNYLSLARTLLANGWTSSINGFWSPLYSWLLAVPMSFHLVSGTSELLWVHAINLGIFFWAMFCFHVFMSHTLRLAAIRAGANNASRTSIETHWYFAGCAIFLFVVLEWLPNSLCTPDLLVASFILLSAGLLTSIVCRDRGWLNYIVLGQALALGYLAKAPAFPLTILFFVMLLFLSRGEKWRWAKCLACVTAFAVVAGPFLYTLSKKEAHLTYGESGRVAFLMYGNGLPAYWLGEGMAANRISANYDVQCRDARVYVFRDAPQGVFYPALEPSRWYAGLVPHIDLRQELRNLRDGFHTLGEMSEAVTDLILGLVILLLISGLTKGMKSVLAWWFLWLPAACGVAMFWLVHVESRFIAPFIVLGYVGLYSGALVESCRKPHFVGKILLALLLVEGGRGVIVVAKGFLSSAKSSTSEAARIVSDLEAAGILQGSKVALIGDSVGSYWAYMGRYSIVGVLPPSAAPKFWGESPNERIHVYSCLAKTGAQGAVTHAETPDLLEPGWQKVGTEDLYLRLLHKD